MKTIIKSFCSLAVCLLFFAGCNSELGKGVKLKDIETGGQVRINLGEKGKAKAYPLPWDCTDYEFKWESANPDIVSVDNYGNLVSKDLGSTVVYVSQGNIKKEIPVEVYEITLAEKMATLGAKGFWQFLDPNDLFKATIGGGLTTVGTGFVQTDGPNKRAKAAVIPSSERVDGVWNFNHLFYNHGFAANGGGSKINEFSIVLDCLFPNGGGPLCEGGNFTAGRWEGGTWTNGKYYSLLQTDLSNGSDANFFWRPSANYGLTGGSYTKLDHTYVRNTWYRFIISVKLGKEIVYYMNGIRYEPGGNGAVDSDQAWNLNGVLLFADDDGEDGQGFPLIVSSLAIFDRALNIDEVIAVGPLFIQE
jgi:hypothetical protein